MSDLGFGERVLDLIKPFAEKLEGVDLVVLRNVMLMDVNGTLGIALDNWIPLEWEMAGQGTQEPTTSTYAFSIQHLVKWANAENGERIHREVAKAVRLMLYRDPDLQLSLRSLYVQEESRKERMLRYHVTNQRFGTTEAVNGTFVFMSITELLCETETVSIP